MSERIREEKNRVVRHGALELFEHWAIALSGLALLLSGLFELPMSARYGINKLPGLAWSSDFITSLSVHYAASVIFIAVSLFHVIHHGFGGDRGLIPRKGDIRTSIAVVKTFFGKGEEPPFGKYLPEQRLAYLGMAFIIAMLILSGLVKTYKNLYAPDLSHAVVLWATWIHNVFFVLFVLAFVAHIGAILIKPNRPLARGIFTGAVRLDYARHRHPLWIAEIEGPSRQPINKGDEEEAQPAASEDVPPPAAGGRSSAEGIAVLPDGDSKPAGEPEAGAVGRAEDRIPPEA